MGGLSHYLAGFTFYTLGVIGLLLVAYIVAKKYINGNFSYKKKLANLEIEETLSISPRKTLHIVKAYNERFLIASDSTSTTLLAKLNSNNEIIEDEISKEDVVDFQEEKFSSFLKQPEEDINTSKINKKLGENSVIQAMLEKLNN